MALTKFKIESGAQLLARLNKRPLLEKFYPTIFQPGLKYDDVVEIFGNSTSNLLIDLICEALFPGKNIAEPVSVLIFNTAGQFNITELIRILNKRIVSNLGCQLETDSLLHKTLNNLFLLDVYDATQFHTTILNLDNILNKHQNISLVIFDSLTAFYWAEQGFKITKMELYVKNLLREIQKICKEHKVIIVYTRPQYFGSCKDSGELETSEIQISDCVNVKVQILDNITTGSYQVIIRMLDSYCIKYFSLLDNEIQWQ